MLTRNHKDTEKFLAGIIYLKNYVMRVVTDNHLQ